MRRHSEEEEPEWFSSGPTSQMDTIELHGFDGPDKHREEEEEEDEDMEGEPHTQQHGKHRTHLQQAREIAGNCTASPFYDGIASVSSISLDVQLYICSVQEAGFSGFSIHLIGLESAEN